MSDDVRTETSQEQSVAPPSAKRKKVNHACVYCRRSHMTCDSGRPCVRCVKRNIGHLCHDEVKDVKVKSPKQDGDLKVNDKLSDGEPRHDLTEETTKHAMNPPSTPVSYAASPSIPTSKVQQQPINLSTSETISKSSDRADTIPTINTNGGLQPAGDSSNFVNEFANYYDAGLFGLPQDSFSHFASEHTNSEFLVLSDFLNIIGSPYGTMPGTPNAFPMQAAGTTTPIPPENRDERMSMEQQMHLQASAAKYTHQGSLPQSRGASAANSRAPSRRPSFSSASRPVTTANSTDGSTAQEKFFLTAADPQLESPEDRLKSVINAKVEAGLMKPFNYVRGYARLQKYMDQNMSADSRARILAPLSTFRPAFRAIAKRLTDVDLILVEEAFERLLLDYDRVFTSMAVPACLWRRTGEIFRGNKEFAALLNLPAESLRDGRLAITELMAEDSAVNYWEKYGDIAFDGQQKAVLTSCLLQVPGDTKGAVVSCCFSFTIKRDRYNIPSCIVGNFIPISF